MRTWALIVWGLFLASFLTAITALVAVIIAYLKRGGAAGTPYESHMTYAIRTFWIALIVGIIGAALSFTVVGVVILMLTVLWQFVRCVRGLMAALNSKPISDPNGWL